MLVLNRKTNEEIFIGQNVTVKIVSVSGSRVRLGISAPRSVPVLRAELRPAAGQPEDFHEAANPEQKGG